MISNAKTNNQGLPYRLTCTYDIINFEQYDTTTFNSMIYLATMQACRSMAKVMGDSATLNLCTDALQVGQTNIIKYLWNNTMNYFRAYSGGNAIMGDCLYGQMIAHHLGLGWSVDTEKIKMHLAAELKYNGDQYGIKVVTGRHNPPPLDITPGSSLRVKQGMKKMVELRDRYGYDGQDDVLWLGAAPDWSYLQIATQNSAIATALQPTEKQLVNLRDRLRDLWNIVGIMTASDWGPDDSIHGMPYVTSHYGFVMTDYYLLTVLSGQQTNIPGGSLKFNPVYDCPFNVPLLIVNTTGVVSCSNGMYKVSISYGKLSLPANGLSVNGKPYPQVVSLVAGQSVTW